jgi:hypothetical protein
VDCVFLRHRSRFRRLHGGRSMGFHAMNLRGELVDTAIFLDGVANQLDQWAKESRNGGWSTHQVEANIQWANNCRRRAAEIRIELARAV